MFPRPCCWNYFEELAKQQVMQVQAAVDAVKKFALGERSIMADGSEYAALFTKEAGRPIEVIYPTEGSGLVPVIVSVMEGAPHPNAAWLFASYLFSLEVQQLISDDFALRSFHPCKVEAGPQGIFGDKGDPHRSARTQGSGGRGQKPLW
jgi:iron(III) transport system substrate-binding protein